MPIYDLRCQTCGSVSEVIILTGEAEPEQCAACGGKLERLLSRFGAPRGKAEGPVARRTAKSCGHPSACRCAVKLQRPNPFADRLTLPR